MTEREAYRILGLPEKAAPELIRRRYRTLIAEVHPDVLQDSQEERPAGHRPLHDARRINQAYALLRKKAAEQTVGQAVEKTGAGYHTDREESGKWNAGTNPNAYCSRDIYGRAEEADGTLIGLFTVARGRYLWSLDEDFHLFLRSVYECSTRLLNEIDASLHRARRTSGYQESLASLTYLLTQQFIDGSGMLKELAAEVTSVSSSGKEPGGEVFHLPAMLEITDPALLRGHQGPSDGDILLPASLRDHRLYLKDTSGRELGYLSFGDDRLYYIVIPLFEQRRVRVRIRVRGSAGPNPVENRGRESAGSKKVEDRGRGSAKSSRVRAGSSANSKRRAKQHGEYINLDLSILFPSEASAAGHQKYMPENLNLQIEKTLKKYREYAQ